MTHGKLVGDGVAEGVHGDLVHGAEDARRHDWLQRLERRLEGGIA